MRNQHLNGILNIDKPYGITSMEVVRRLKRRSGIKRVGHGGTLDPLATGVIPICFGQATRMMEYLVSSTKEYRAVIRFGMATDTYDALGETTSQKPVGNLSLTTIENTLDSFKGIIYQIPPMYSALKRHGKRLYNLARAGIEIELEPREVAIHHIEILNWTPPLVTLEVNCGRGLYVRSLAHDLGQALKCGGHLQELVRLKSGPFKILDSLSLANAEEKCSDGTWIEKLHTPDVVLTSLPAVILGKKSEQIINHGQSLPTIIHASTSNSQETCRAYSTDGRFLAILKFDNAKNQLLPQKVFSMNCT